MGNKTDAQRQAVRNQRAANKAAEAPKPAPTQHAGHQDAVDASNRARMQAARVVIADPAKMADVAKLFATWTDSQKAVFLGDPATKSIAAAMVTDGTLSNDEIGRIRGGSETQTQDGQPLDRTVANPYPLG